MDQIHPGTLLELFELRQYRPGDSRTGPIYEFSNNTNEKGEGITFNGVLYARTPIEAEGWEFTTDGHFPTPTMRIGNVGQVIGRAAREYNYFLDWIVIRHRVFAKYIDEINFVGGNPLADPLAEFPVDIYFVSRLSSETKQQIEWELCAALDLEGVALPAEMVSTQVCTYIYRSADCGYTGGPVAKVDDTPTTDPALDKCGHKVKSCLLRNLTDVRGIPFGGCPAAGLGQ